MKNMVDLSLLPKNNLGVIYCITSPSGKVYVGQTFMPVDSRWRFYRNYSCKKQPKIYNALKKYKSENFSYEILDYCFDQESLNDAECYWINYYDSIKNGYNCKEGGTMSGHIRETKIKISKSLLGRRMSNETRKKISISKKLKNRKGNNCHMFGKKRKQETCEKIRKANSGKNSPYYGTKLSDKQKNKIRMSLCKRKYLMTSPEKILYITDNIVSFCAYHKLLSYCIYRVLNGTRKHHKGWIANII